MAGSSSRTTRSSGAMISVRGRVSRRWSWNARRRTSLSPSVSAARRMWPFWPTPFFPYRSDSPSHAITAVTSSPSRAWSAAVPPQPRSSSSGWAAITSTRLAIGPPLSGPGLLGQGVTPEHGAVLPFELEQHDGALTARHQLAARFGHRAHHRTEDLARRAGGLGLGQERRLPDPPAPPIEPAERAGVGTSQRADEVVDRLARLRPV